MQLITAYYPKYAEKAKAVKLIDVDAKTYYGEGYQDVSLRVPSIRHAREYIRLAAESGYCKLGLRKTLDFYLQ